MNKKELLTITVLGLALIFAIVIYSGLIRTVILKVSPSPSTSPNTLPTCIGIDGKEVPASECDKGA